MPAVEPSGPDEYRWRIGGQRRTRVIRRRSNARILWQPRVVDGLEQAGIGPLNLKISDRAQITFPFHRNEDAWEEERLGKGAYGSTKRGIAPAYGDRYLKKALLMGELFYPEFLKERLRPVVEWKNAIAKGVYGKPGNLTVAEVFDWAIRHGEKLKPMITNTTAAPRRRRLPPI